MDREGFRNRLNQYKEAKGFDPQLSYWEWKQKYDSALQPDKMPGQPQSDQPISASQHLDNRSHRWDSGYSNVNREPFDSPYDDSRYYDHRKPRFEFRKGDTYYSNPNVLKWMGRFGKVLRGGSLLGEAVQNLFPSEEAELIEDLRVKMDKQNKWLTGQADIPKYDEGGKVIDSVDLRKVVDNQNRTAYDRINYLKSLTSDKEDQKRLIDSEKEWIEMNLTGNKGIYAIDAGQLPELMVTPTPIYATLRTEYPVINENTPWTGHSSLFLDDGGAYVSVGGKDKNYNLFSNNCSNATKRVLERTFGKEYPTILFTTPGDVLDFAVDELNAKEVPTTKRGVREHKIRLTPEQSKQLKYEAYVEKQNFNNRPVKSKKDYYDLIYKFAEGTDGVNGPPTEEQWYADINKYNPTILDNASLEWSMNALKKELHSKAMELPEYAPMWNNYVRSLPKADPDIEEFVDDLWLNENPNNVGLKNGKYYPHKSPEGGKMTIGPGFKLGSGQHKITEKQAKRGMTKSYLDQEVRRVAKGYFKDVDAAINSGQTTNPADTVSPQIKAGLADILHQTGSLKKWPKLINAVREGDLEKIQNEAIVTWRDNNGVLYEDKRRNELRNKKNWHYAEGTDQVEPTPEQVLEKSKSKINGIPITDSPIENVFSPLDVMLGTAYRLGPLMNKILPNYGPALGSLVLGSDHNKTGNQPLMTKKLDPDVSEFYNDIVIPMNPNDEVYKRYFMKRFGDPNIEIHSMNDLPDGFAADFNPNTNLIRIGDKYALSPNYQQFEAHEYGHLLDKYLPYGDVTQRELNNTLPVSKTPISKDSDTYRERQSTKREAEFKTFKKLKDAGKLKLKTARAKTKRYQEYLANATDEEILELLGADTAYKKDYLSGNIDVDTLRQQMMYAPTIAAGIIVPTNLLQDDKEWT